MRAEILARYADQPLPRYTSYPTAPHFIAAVGAGTYREWLEAMPPSSDSSLYLHLPFCRSMCWYCGCHTTVTARDEPIARYVDALHREIDLVAEALPGRITARHIHFGGGTPTLMQPVQFVATPRCGVPAATTYSISNAVRRSGFYSMPTLAVGIIVGVGACLIALAVVFALSSIWNYTPAPRHFAAIPPLPKLKG